MLKLTTLQTVTREFDFIIYEAMDSDKLLQVAKSTNKDLIKDVLIYDVYKGNKIPIDKKSIAIKVFIHPIHETLTDTDLEKISSDLIAVVNKKLSGTLRDE